MIAEKDFIINFDEPILVTGAGGFIGTRVVAMLISYGFRNLRCFVRVSSNVEGLNRLISNSEKAKIQVITGNLLSPEDCRRGTENVSLVFHLAAGTEKTFAGCYMNSVVATRNLLEALLENGKSKRFVNVSSIAVYSNRDANKTKILDETSEMDGEPALRHEAYVYGKVKQDEILLEYARRFKIPYVIVRPGEVFGPGKRKISGRVGIDTFSIFLHLGGRNQVPLVYVDNCAEAIILAGIAKGVDGEIFNIMDDNLPTSREFLNMYKKKVKQFRSIYVPYGLFYFLSFLWEKYSIWSRGQFPMIFNRRRCIAHWKFTRYSNDKAKRMLGWNPKVSRDEAFSRYFNYMKSNGESR